MRDKADKTKIAKKIGYWILLNVGTLLLAAGVYFFKAPNNFATGGVSGISIILNKYITFLTQSEIMLIINVFLLIVGFIFLGKGCTYKTVYCSLVYSLEMWAMQYLPINLPLTNNTFLEFVYAMMLTGIGSAIIFNCNASSGGTDIVALIIKKYTKLDVGKALLVTDFLIALSTFFIFDIKTGLYSVLGLFFKAFLVDSVIENIGKNKYVTIVTSNPDLITPYILQGINRGFTKFKATGGYTNEEKTIIMVVCRRIEAQKLKLKLQEVDPESFVIFTDTNEILGKGFRGA
jgi:uncharacterized membrane-anchored protein YitT (DUF2179 family)